MWYKTEKDLILDEMWKLVLRETGVKDDLEYDWFTQENYTYVGSTELCISTDIEVAKLINAINALRGFPEFINVEKIYPESGLPDINFQKRR
jgi:hypothetical protein